MKLLIQNGRVIDPVRQSDQKEDLYIENGKIVGMGQKPGFVADQTIDATNLIVCPGLVDLSARLREPGNEHKAMLTSELSAAIKGGVTSLVCPPDTDPVLDEPGLVEMLKTRAKARNQTHVYPLGALTIGLKGEALTEMAELTDAGCVGFTQALSPIKNTEVLMKAMQYAKTFDYSVWLSPQDAWLGRNGVAHSGAVAARLGLPGIPSISETISLYMLFELVRQTGVRLHLCRVSTAKGIQLIREAKKEGLPITCDVSIHHLHLTENDIDFFNANMRMLPPVRSESDKKAISEGLVDQTIDVICSDHAPVDDDEKALPFGEATPGVTGLELFLPLTLKWGASARLSLMETLAKITSEPARILKHETGKIALGQVADLCIFDPNQTWTVKTSSFVSQGRNTPFIGHELKGVVKATIVEGQIAYRS